MGVPHVCMLSCFSCVRLFGTPGTVAHQVPLSMKFCRPGTVAHQAPLSMEFSRQEYWSGWPRDPTHISCSSCTEGRFLFFWATGEVAQSFTCPTLCDPGQNTVVGSLSLLQGIFPTQGSTQVSHITGRFFTSWATREAQEYWSGHPIPSPADLPDPGIELGSPALQADSLPSELSGCMYVLLKKKKKKKRIDLSCRNDSVKILYHLKIYTCKNIN